jgi:hypothetical protein
VERTLAVALGGCGMASLGCLREGDGDWDGED